MRLCHIDDLPNGQARGLAPDGTGRATVLVVRRGHELRAYLDACPHQGKPMAWRQDAYLDAARQHIVCFAHGAQFDIDTGLCLRGPCEGDALVPVPLILRDDGEVHVAPGTATSP